jgi:hypothetical protein
LSPSPDYPEDRVESPVFGIEFGGIGAFIMPDKPTYEALEVFRGNPKPSDIVMTSQKRGKWFAAIWFLLLSLVSPANCAENDRLKSFVALINRYGWEGEMTSEGTQYDDRVLIRGAEFVYQFPEHDGYFPRIGFYELTFRSVHDAKGFRIENYKSLFPKVVVWEHHEYIRWRTHRHENINYVIYAYPTRQDIDTFFRIFTQYLQSHLSGGLGPLERKLKDQYETDLRFFQAVKTTQSVLRDQGFYEGDVDGVFGYETRKGLQRLLRTKGFYRGKIDGLLGKGSIVAFKRYQKSLGVKETGIIGLETAEAMKNQETW